MHFLKSLDNFTLIHDVYLHSFQTEILEMWTLESRKVLRLLSIFMVGYFLWTVYDSAIYTFFFLRGQMLAIPYAAKVDFCFLTQYARLAIFGYLLYNTFSKNNNSECLFVGAPRFSESIWKVTEHHSNELCGQNESLNVRARGVHTTYYFCDF